ncbi:MAG: hypothetical protein ACRC2T_08595 [Thermoguttaceae bacterium]
MSINVICPGCLKRFEVSEKFAGKKGPCPNCKTIIDIPKEQVVIHAPEEFVSGGKTVKGRAILKPITRLNTEFKTKSIIISAVGSLLVIVLAALLGWVKGKFGVSTNLYDLLGILGLAAISFPLTMFGYELLRESDELEFIQGNDLYKKSAICGGVYTLLWVFFELLTKYMQSEEWITWLAYLIPFIVFAVIASHILFDFDFPRGVLHFLVFFGPLLLLRGLIGLGWLWLVVSEITSGSGGSSIGPPPPPPPVGR